MGSPAKLAEKVKRLLTNAFNPAEVEVSTRDGIVVIVVSARFEGMDDMDRQKAVWDILRQSLDSKERRAIAIVVALTPKEHGFHLAGQKA
jgi:acid stress-induced BolA-like protein IbaG/YrbA